VKVLVALLLALVPLASRAYEPLCVPDRYGVNVPTTDGLSVVYGRHSAGWWAYWFCKKPDGYLQAEGFWCVHGECKNPDALATEWRATAPGIATDPAAASKSYIAASVTKSGKCADYAEGTPHRTVCDYRTARVVADLGKFPKAAPVPAEGGWVVAAAAASANPPGTRPAYPWPWPSGKTPGSGVAAISGVRAPQGTACDTKIGQVVGSSAYYGVNQSSSQVSLCVKVSPPS
jgi:hypothetical protein